MRYNLDDNTSLVDLLGFNSPNKVMSIGQRIAIKHYSMFDYCYSFIVDINKDYIKIKFRSSLPELDFFPEDPVVISFVDNEVLYFANSEVVSVESLDPLCMELKVNRIEKKDTLRKNERFYVSLACTLMSSNCSETTFGIIKNLSFSGFKINSKKEFSEKDTIDLVITIDKYYHIECTGSIVRKNKLSLYYEYGVELSEISKTNMLTFQHYINQLKGSN